MSVGGSRKKVLSYRCARLTNGTLAEVLQTSDLRVTSSDSRYLRKSISNVLLQSLRHSSTVLIMTH